MITMEIDILNEHVMKIIVATRKVDSINAISKRIGLSYGWTYKWVKELIKIGCFRQKGLKLFLNTDNKFYRNTLNYIKSNFRRDIGFNYSVLGLFGIKYCFTKTDAVFVWTKGGYNIARSKDYYPIFIRIKKEHYITFLEYCRKLGLRINVGTGVFYFVEVLSDFEVSHLDNIPVESLKDTIRFMKKYIYNFQPALEMIGEMYNKDLRVRYKEVKNV